MDIKEHYQVRSICFFYNKTGSGAIAISKVVVSVNKKLAKEFHKPVFKKFKRRKIYARFKGNI